ncbi:MAG: 3-phosphoshikimate 1-carboxyvinyltransferase [Spirochaetes bacterium]|nr:MAG: 3-phosphoshikimate 1-carboxyvinyltransferase [Spirochaetota bacterium]
MKYHVKPSVLRGEVPVPGSKSHTIRALICGLLAEGESRIGAPLDSSDTRSCLAMVRRFGAGVVEEGDAWRISGRAGNPALPDDVVDVGNSGTSLYIGMGAAALVDGCTVFTGDGQIRNRPADQLLASLNDLGAHSFSTRGNGKPPLVIRGRMTGGRTSVQAHTSQYLSALLLAAPCASGDTTIEVPLLNEAPYVEMTLGWMDRLGIAYEQKDLRHFFVRGGQRYRPFDEYIAADFSSATFFLVAAAVTGGALVLRGLDFSDTQGDKEVVNILRAMGADIETGERHVAVSGRALKGGTFDLNAIPDALPALAVAGCMAAGETRLVNVPQARLKETDRIAVMCAELRKMGASIEERPDGLVIRESALRGAAVRGHGDHRVVMSLAVAGLTAAGETVIDTAESVAVTFPGFMNLMRGCGAAMEIEEDA